MKVVCTQAWSINISWFCFGSMDDGDGHGDVDYDGSGDFDYENDGPGDDDEAWLINIALFVSADKYASFMHGVWCINIYCLPWHQESLHMCAPSISA